MGAEKALPAPSLAAGRDHRHRHTAAAGAGRLHEVSLSFLWRVARRPLDTSRRPSWAAEPVKEVGAY